MASQVLLPGSAVIAPLALGQFGPGSGPVACLACAAVAFCAYAVDRRWSPSLIWLALVAALYWVLPDDPLFPVSVAAVIPLLLLVPVARECMRSEFARTLGFGSPAGLGAALLIGMLSVWVVLEWWKRAGATLVVDVPSAFSGPAFIVGGVLLFSLVNAFGEELLWRGALFTELMEGCVGRSGVLLAIVVSSTSFGLAHYEGFPFGWNGVALAGVFGAALGTLRVITRFSGGAVTAHFIVDACIGLPAVLPAVR